MKIDVQGHEIPALQGAERALKDVVGIEIELTGVEAYAGAPRVGEVLAKMVDWGFELITLDHISYNNRRGVFQMADALFVRPEFPILDLCPLR